MGEPLKRNVVRLHMLKATLSLGILFAVSTAAGGRGAKSPTKFGIDQCPAIAVSCPDRVEGNSDLHAYAGVAGSTGNNLKYHWTVTWPSGTRKGHIKSGQDTSSLVIFIPRSARGSLTVTVRVAGLDKACRNDESCSTMIAPN